MKNKLNRMKKHIVREAQVDTKKKEVSQTVPAVSIPYWNQWEKVNTSIYSIDEQYCFIKESRYPLTYQHGNHSFDELVEVVEAWQQFEGSHPLSGKGLDVNDLFFFDTETTGLGGGVGNVIFLLGYAQVQGNEIKVRQHVLPSPGNEVALYHSFLEKIDYSTLVTYNGKAFDWPQVKTRHTLVRDHVPKLPSFGHFDLFHGARRMWKHKIESVKLQNVEKEILGFYRKDDVPGYLAPMIYFDYVQQQNPEGMLQILKHNEEDILSLISLYIHLSKQLLQIDEKQSSFEKLLVGEWFHYLGDQTEANSTFQQLKAEEEYIALPAMHRLAFQAKKNKNYDEAYSYWVKVSGQGIGKIKGEAYLELAKIQEHYQKDFEAALTSCEKMKPHIPETQKQALAKRMERLERKLKVDKKKNQN
ncbi:ribonuclease H-like domain-containing protein [Bacillus sp. 2205SS5-2]|uniref:ribonuclease H-like domain-containing protein n=1 Tax=Bacillus sp. 2205SS5-2 TaxID=3109031 RepID=UPI003005F6E8